MIIAVENETASPLSPYAGRFFLYPRPHTHRGSGCVALRHQYPTRSAAQMPREEGGPSKLRLGKDFPLRIRRLRKLAERVGFEPRLSNKINQLEGANGTSSLYDSTKTSNSTFYWTLNGR